MRSEVRTCARSPRLRADLPALLVLALLLIGAADGEPPSVEAAGEAEAAQEAAEPDPLAEAEAELLARIDALHVEIRELEAGLRDASGDDRRGLEVAVARRWLGLIEEVEELAGNLLEQEADGRDGAALRARIEGELAGITRFLDRVGRQKNRELDRDRAALEKATGDEKAEIEARIAEEESWIAGLFGAFVEHILVMEKIGVDSSATRARLARELGTDAEATVGRLELARFQREQIEESLARAPGDAALQAQLAAVEQEGETIAERLATTVAMMEKLGLETTDYQRVLIEETGEITTDVLDSEVAIGLLESWTREASEQIRANGPEVLLKSLIFVAILGIFRLIASALRRLVRRAVSASRLNVSQLLQETAISISSKVVMGIGILVALSQLGVEIGPLLAGIGVAGFIIGFALQDTLGNFASGAMILIYRPYDVDDMIECAGGVYGQVARMSLVSTTILTVDNQTLVVPNSKIWGDVIKNVTAQRVRRVDLSFHVAHDEDVERVETIFRDVLAKHEKVLDDPPINVAIHHIGETSVEFIVRPWVATADYWDVYWDVIRAVKRRFDEEGIRMPYRHVHVHPPPPASSPG